MLQTRLFLEFYHENFIKAIAFVNYVNFVFITFSLGDGKHVLLLAHFHSFRVCANGKTETC